MSDPDLTIAREPPDQPDVLARLAALDDDLATLDRPEDNHILGPAALLADVEFLAARERGAHVGAGALRRMPGEPATGGRPYVEITRMVVDPAARGRRIGALLLAPSRRSPDGTGSTSRSSRRARGSPPRSGSTSATPTPAPLASSPRPCEPAA